MLTLKVSHLNTGNRQSTRCLRSLPWSRNITAAFWIITFRKYCQNFNVAIAVTWLSLLSTNFANSSSIKGKIILRTNPLVAPPLSLGFNALLPAGNQPSHEAHLLRSSLSIASLVSLGPSFLRRRQQKRQKRKIKAFHQSDLPRIRISSAATSLNSNLTGPTTRPKWP